MHLRVNCLATFASTVLLASVVAAATEDEAAAVVELFHASLVDVAQTAPGLSLEQRIEALSPVVEATHDLARMARLAISGTAFRSWEEQQQQVFSETFARLSVTTYASRFSSVTPATFEVIGSESSTETRVVVDALIHRTDDEPVEMFYDLRRVGENWRIAQLRPDGVSEIARMRARYSDIHDSGGFDAVIAEIEREIAEFYDE